MSFNSNFDIHILLQKSTKGMKQEAVIEGFFEYRYMECVTQTKIPKIQILTVEDLFAETVRVFLPPNVIEPCKKAVNK